MTDMATASSNKSLEEAYDLCRKMQRRHDPTFYLATRRLPAEIRPSVHAVYGFVRTADEIVDGPRRADSAAERLAALNDLELELAAARSGEKVRTPSVNAIADAARTHDLPLDELGPYLNSMRRDIEPLRIVDWSDLESYMEGSAGSVGRIMAPLLGALSVSPSVRRGITFARAIYLRTLDRVESLGFDVTGKRASLSPVGLISAGILGLRG